jgi:molybdopterin synthase sulfur carrier subunit
MPVTLVFLGRIEDCAGAPESEAAAGTLAQIVAGFTPELARAVSAPRVRLALNGHLVSDARALVLVDGDELAFLPPVSGG